MKGKEEGGEREKAQGEKKEDEATTAPLPERVSMQASLAPQQMAVSLHMPVTDATSTVEFKLA